MLFLLFLTFLYCLYYRDVNNKIFSTFFIVGKRLKLVKNGRQQTGYSKLKIFEFTKIDCWLLEYKESSYIPDHKDKCDIGDIYRLNVVLTKPLYGGKFKCENVVFNVCDRIVLFNASQYTHSCDVIHGNKNRYVLSLGFII